MCAGISYLTTHFVVAVTNYEQALSFLNAEPDTPDEWIPSLVTAKVCFCSLLLHPCYITWHLTMMYLPSENGINWLTNLCTHRSVISLQMNPQHGVLLS